MIKKVLTIIAVWLPSILILGFLDQPERLGMEGIPALGPLLSPSHGYLQNGAKASELSYWNTDLLEVNSSSFIIRDQHHIPHIFSDNDLDAYQLQGFVEAVDRFWQMDFIARATAGRLSEIFGAKAIDYDITQRKKGLLRASKSILKKWKTYPESYAILQAYTKGINTYYSQLNSTNLPIEYKILGYQPEPWTELKTALFFKYMSDILCSMESDLERHDIKQIIGEEQFAFLFGRKNQKDIPVIPTDYSDSTWLPPTDHLPDSSGIQKLGFARPFKKYPSGLGSNNWAIAPDKSENNQAILANDPHLQLKLPSIWYLIHIVTPNQNAMGVSFPSAPGIILGFNEEIAWGVTNVGQDVLDWHPVQVDSAKAFVFLGKDTLKGTWITDTITVKDAKDIYPQTLWTEHGPVWYQKSEQHATHALMKWIAHEPGDEDDLSVFPGINKASNLAEFNAVINKYESPAQNFVVATSEGDIALKVQGDLPVRKKDIGNKFDQLNGSEDLWKENIPDNRLPYAQNPTQNYLASANQVSTDTSYPYRYFIGDNRSERGRTINKELRQKEKVSIQDMKDLQLNSFHISAYEFIQSTSTFLKGKGKEGQLLLDWDGRHLTESKAATLYSMWFLSLRKMLFDEWNYLEDYIYPDMWVIVDLIQHQREHPVFDIIATKDITENCEDLLELSWKETMSNWGAMDEKEWYKYRATTIPHTIGLLKPFGIQEVKSDGTGKAPLALTRTVGPSWRLIHQPGSDQPALGIYPGGQSGHPGSPHYTDFFEKWRTGEYLELNIPSSPDQVDHVKEVIQLNP